MKFLEFLPIEGDKYIVNEKLQTADLFFRLRTATVNFRFIACTKYVNIITKNWSKFALIEEIMDLSRIRLAV